MILLRWLINALALLIISQIVPGFAVASTWSALMAALVLGLVNALIRPIVLLLTLPINLLTLGVFTLVVNALMVLLASSIVKGFEVAGFWPAFWGALLLWLVSLISNSGRTPTWQQREHR